MATVKIEKVFRKEVETKYGTRESVGIKPATDVVQDINGDDITMDGRWINGFRDSNGETDKWQDGMTVKILIVTKKYTRKDGTEGEAVNFKLPEGVSSIVEDVVEDPDNF